MQFSRAVERGTAGPAVVGVLRPKIVVPDDFGACFSGDEQRLILAHEQTHIARKDPLSTGFVALSQCLNWFNPLAHVAAHYARLDQELACDADVLVRFPGQRRTYAEALLKSQLASSAPLLGCHWPSRSIHPLEERVAMLAKPRPGKIRRLIGAVSLVTLLLGSGYGAWALDGPQDHNPVAAATVGAATSGLTMRLAAENEGGGAALHEERVRWRGGDIWLEPNPVITRDMISTASSKVDASGHPFVAFQMTPLGKKRFSAVTRQNIGRRLAILIDGKVVSTPVIRGEISRGAGEISGDFSAGEAKTLADEITGVKPLR